MSWWEIYIPAADDQGRDVTLSLEAPNWLGALRTGLSDIGQSPVSNIVCEVQADGAIVVTEPQSGRVFRLREGTSAPEPASKIEDGFATQMMPQPQPTMASQPPVTQSQPPIVTEPAQAPTETAAPAPAATQPAPPAPAAIQPSPPASQPPAPQPPAPAATQPPAPAAPQPPAPQPPAPQPPAPAATQPPAPTAPASPQPPAPQPPAPASTQPPPAQPSAPAATQPPAPQPPAPQPPAPQPPAPQPPPPAATQPPAPTTPVAAPPAPPPPAATQPPAPTPATPPPPAATQPPAAPSPQPAPPPKRDRQFDTGPVPVNRRETPPSGERIIETPATVDAQELIEELFFATQELSEADLKPGQVADRILALAMDTIPAESGSFFLADPGLPILKFAAARGPRANELLSSGLTVPVGQGIVGFCAQEGVSLTVNDMTKDPRYFAKVAEAISHQPNNTVVASVERDGRLYGAIQLINAKRSSGFDPGEAEVLRFLGLTAAQMLES